MSLYVSFECESCENENCTGKGLKSTVYKCGGYKHKQTNADRIRSMTDEALAELIGDNIDCSICKKEVFETTTCPGSLTADGKDCYGCWLDWLRQEANNVDQ